MQTFRSDYGRKGIRVADTTPTRAITHHLSRVAVGTPVDEVVDEVKAEIAKRVSSGAEGWTQQVIRDSVRFTIWQHLENREEYLFVMRGMRSWLKEA